LKMNLHCVECVVWLCLVVISVAENSPPDALCMLQHGVTTGKGVELEHARAGTLAGSKVRALPQVAEAGVASKTNPGRSLEASMSPIAKAAPPSSLVQAKGSSIAQAAAPSSLVQAKGSSTSQAVSQPAHGDSLLLHAVASGAIAAQKAAAQSPCSPDTPAPSPDSGSPSPGAPCRKAEVVLLAGAKSQDKRVAEHEAIGSVTRLLGLDLSTIIMVCGILVLVLGGYFIYSGGTWQQLHDRPAESLKSGYGDLREDYEHQEGVFRQKKSTDCLGVPCC